MSRLAPKNELMARVRSKNSKAERLVFSYLRKNKIYFQKHYKGAPGNPDIALPRKKRAVFIDGDFWHGRTLGQVIRNRGREDFWVLKVQRNIVRDKKQEHELQNTGWRILRVWESDINRKRTHEESLEKIKNFLLS